MHQHFPIPPHLIVWRMWQGEGGGTMRCTIGCLLVGSCGKQAERLLHWICQFCWWPCSFLKGGCKHGISGWVISSHDTGGRSNWICRWRQMKLEELFSFSTLYSAKNSFISNLSIYRPSGSWYVYFLFKKLGYWLKLKIKLTKSTFLLYFLLNSISTFASLFTLFNNCGLQTIGEGRAFLKIDGSSTE